MQREDRDRIYSKKVRAGKRTYFFDVRSTRSNDYFLTITESRRYQRDGDFVYEKSKMFIYKEDFEKFVEALQDTVNHIKSELNPDFDYSQFTNDEATETYIGGELETSGDESDEDFATEKETDDTFEGSELKWD